MDSFGKYLTKAFAKFQSLPSSRRLAIGGVAALVALGLVLLAKSDSWTAEREYLYGGQEFSRDEIIAIETAFGDASLSDWKVVGYRVEIPATHKAAYLAALAESGFQPGMDVRPEQAGIFVPASEKAMRAQYEKQKKVARFVESMPGIQEASVVYTSSTSGGFPRTIEKRAAAAVIATGGRHLDPQEVAAIQSVIVASEAGLPTENVVVLDTNAKRTYDGSKDAAEIPAQSVMDISKKLYEDRVQQQIRNRLVNYPGLIVEVSVQPAVISDETSDSNHSVLAVKGIAVSIGVPSSYYERLWNKRHSWPNAGDTNRPSHLDLAKIESETLLKIEEIVAGLLNEIDLPDARQPNIVVRTDEDFAPVNQVAQTGTGQLWATLSQRGQPLLVALIALVIVSGWLVISRQKKKPSGKVRPAFHATELPITARKSADARVEADFANGSESTTHDSSENLQEQLSRLVQQDPDAAVDALRKWIRKVA